jgi:hypothetical protein
MEKFCSGYGMCSSFVSYLLVDVSALKAIVAAVTFMLRNAAKYNVKPDIVSLELQQLGLPKSISSHFHFLSYLMILFLVIV